MTTTTSRRAVLAGAATMPALAVPAIATAAEPDPIFAAIERHRSAWAALESHCGDCSRNEANYTDDMHKAAEAKTAALSAAAYDVVVTPEDVSVAVVVEIRGTLDVEVGRHDGEVVVRHVLPVLHFPGAYSPGHPGGTRTGQIPLGLGAEHVIVSRQSR